MEERINQALAQLEKDLQEINSARNQVESTVKASTELQKVVGEYVSSVNALCVGLQSWGTDLRTREGELSHEYESAITRINTTCTDIINSFGTVINQTSTEFKSKTENVIDKFTEQNKIFTDRVQDLNAIKEDIKKATTEIQTIKESLSQISKDLKESQGAQDEILRRIDTNVTDLPNAISSATDSIIQRVNSCTQDLMNGIESVSHKAHLLNEKVDSTLATLATIATECQNIKNDISSSTSALTTTVTNAKEEIAKSIRTNRWIFIIGFIILVILLFIIK